MDIVYHIREKDLLAGMRFIRKVSPTTKRINSVGVIIVVLIPCINFLLRRRFTTVHITRMLVEILIFAVIYAMMKIVLQPLFDWQTVAALKQKSGGILGEHRICLTEEKLIESTSVNESHQKWTGIEGVYENEDYILIMITGQQGHIIPKRAFASSDAAKQFYSQAHSYHEGSRVS